MPLPETPEKVDVPFERPAVAPTAVDDLDVALVLPAIDELPAEGTKRLLRPRKVLARQDDGLGLEQADRHRREICY